MENHKEVEPISNWSNMYEDILEEICKRLTIPNQIRFSTACKTWLSANTSKKACHWIPNAPWLVSKDYMNDQLQVVSSTDKQAYKICKPFKPLSGTLIVGSSKGWLMIRSSLKLFIINLFSKLHLDLPTLNMMSCLLCSKGEDCFHIHLPIALAISTCPNMNPALVAMVTYDGYLGWCKVGDIAWKGLHTSDWFYVNVTFHDDKLYAVDRDGEKVNKFKYDEGVLIQVGSVISMEPSNFSLPENFDMRIYLVECGRRVLMVKKVIDHTNNHMPTINFVISAVEEEDSSTPLQLVEVKSLDDHILFVAETSIECLDAKYCSDDQFQRDRVYFTNYYSKNMIINEVGEFSIAKGNVVKSSPLMSPNMQSPVWVLPRFPFDCDCEVCSSAPWIIRPEKNEDRPVMLKSG